MIPFNAYCTSLNAIPCAIATYVTTKLNDQTLNAILGAKPE